MPLTSIRVLDLTRLLPGPYCSMLLADFGADVIKIEDKEMGDYARRYTPLLDEDSAIFHALNRNKKSVCLNLKLEKDKASFLQMVESADVVLESFRPGVMKKLGVDYEILKTINPRIIYCSITGYGQTGPYAQEAGHDINYLSYAGLLHLMGEQGGKPIIPATQIADIGGGAYPAALGILLSLWERESSGKGQLIDISMMDGVIAWLQATLPNYLATNQLQERGAHQLNGAFACYNVYETQDSRWLAVGALEHKFWQAFCETIGRKELISQQHATLQEQHRMKYVIQTVIQQKTLTEWLELFECVEACVTPVRNFSEVVDDPQVKARNMILSLPHPTLGIVNQIGIPIKLSKTPGRIHSLAPKHGEHTEAFVSKLTSNSTVDDELSKGD
ncbi:CoA transferase [Virgibacillus pantothenticus]|uniref:Carnitine dehydratase n=1 Tax=Virgibacillus pantothenticus TaxID=1473 RepID=A0A0L0QMT9_VIRPA|nr:MULTISPECIES: CoA transferase [Virgibacillus]API93266.1 carnitine dehydratase [Virgibacillus sp. 6R]KNE19543.1 carnitine dehydratase [Virgibacillus pantothenticus]MBS7428688.1 CoA transferase [Virgibacillus sp. 19R1-5]MBU8565783.1 CoA transferase [Virgibacillus pantothenticus]MBU8599630.1 CoA transferase [Virgibacillus pantothenticus]